ncbi:Site-specific DNA recombinase [Arthrobacter sp. UNCCL28]|uniref:recombinase family protein n=1 Tax=Micrococcaceae TaxID=1268 RepID=UPI000875F22A|nr:recombinase family protein [Paenarthrobacter nicotinovorans]SCZ52605.1 Site-specific DNA recombinase [Arthrobacter sp. UNCCL28]
MVSTQKWGFFGKLERLNISIGYARESNFGPSLADQVQVLKAAGAVDVYEERATGATELREQWRACLEALKPGDSLLVSDLTRLGRSTSDLVGIIALLAERSVTFRVVAEPWLDTGGQHGRVILGLFESIANYERSRLSERTTVGLAAARARGRLGGRPPAMTPHKLEAARNLRSKKMTLSEIADTLGVSTSTVARALSGPL